MLCACNSPATSGCRDQWEFGLTCSLHHSGQQVIVDELLADLRTPPERMPGGALIALIFVVGESSINITGLHIEEITVAVCSACEQVWLDHTWRGGQPEPRAFDALDTCFSYINATCWDCTHTEEGGSIEAVCQHDSWYAHPAPISGRFSFCSGHAATTLEAMSYNAWMRLITWRSLACPSAFRRTAYASLGASRSRPDAHWLNYYEAGESGWQDVEDKEGAGGLRHSSVTADAVAEP